MIRITVELLPFGDSSKPQHLGTATISNDGSGTHTTGNYRVRLSQKGRPDVIWRTGKVENFPRKRLGAWDLLCRALQATVGERNQP